ncbi:hypothetical protein JK191_13890 [Gluconobacter sphaericus]|uniref:histidine-type phosphatase n=1 Tax=Gluconobacter sphaericus TaxID=574987 RepID=UPI001B8BB500|nr:histidine-type phosphatase [Gluconobacter sphaericus]MBS1098610.1 hypothetical protein [Gluconobacter sphaericus]
MARCLLGFSSILLALYAVGIPLLAHAQERILAEVVIMRHGIRAPILPSVSTPSLTQRPWVRWENAPGQLTHHGRQVVNIVGHFQAMAWRRMGLMPADCPVSEAFTAIADTDQRTLDTAQEFVGASFPTCNIPVTPATALPENPFRPVETTETLRTATVAMSRALEGFHPDPVMVRTMKEFGEVMENPDWNVAPGKVSVVGNEWPVLRGPLLAAFQVTDTFMMEYEEGMTTGWGKLNEADVERLLSLNTLYARLTRRVSGVAEPETAVIGRLINDAFVQSVNGKRHVTLIVGHDDTLNALAGELDLHWHAAGLPADMPLPAGALIFDLLDEGQHQLGVRFRYSAPALDDARMPEQLQKHGPVSMTVISNKCGEEKVCSYSVFQKIIHAHT